VITLSKTRRKQWKCPHCPQTSSRHWNVVVHIKRRHDGIGSPIEATIYSPSSVADIQFPPNVNSTEIRNFHSESNSWRNRAFSQDINRVEKKRMGSTDSLEGQVRFLRLLAERQDLLKKLSPNLPQNPMTSLLNSQLQLNTFQINNTMEFNQLPTGYRTRLCDRCLEGNICEPVFASTQTEALSKEMVGHCCMPEAIAILDQKQNKADLIKRVHGELFYMLSYIVSSRVGLKGIQDEADLECKELDNKFLTEYPHSMLPLGVNRTWKKPEEFTDLGPIIDNAQVYNMNQEKHWAVRATEIEGQNHEKIIKIDMNELKEFLRVAKASYGVFRARVVDDGPVR
jgi:hypothetical protein